MALKASQLKVGDTYQEQVATNLSRTQIVQYAGASGDYMPLHTDELYAREIAGYPGVFATGDCAQIYHPQICDYWVSIGHDNAVNLGRTAALNLLGGKVMVEAAQESIFEVQGIRVNTSWWMEY